MNEENKKEEKQGTSEKIYQSYEYAHSFFAKWIALILTLVIAISVFVVSSMTAGKEIEAPNSISSQIMQQWREANPGEIFPEQYIGTFEFTTQSVFNEETHNYYFVIDSYVLDENGVETQTIKDWHWAYDGGMEYVFKDWRFYFFTALVFSLSTFIVIVNYSSSKSKARGSKSFKATEKQYALVKDDNDVKQNIDLLDDFCVYQNKQAYDDKKNDIVVGADILWSEYNEKYFDKKNLWFWQKNTSGLANWQKKKLREIRRIKINRLKKTDLLQETSSQSKTKIQMLPQSEASHDKRFFTFNSIQRFLTTFVSGLVIVFSIKFVDWNLGVTYAITILGSAIGATIAGADFVLTKLRHRIIAKRDYLIEFKAMIPMLKEQRKQREEAFKKAYDEQIIKARQQEDANKKMKKEQEEQKNIKRLGNPQVIPL